MAARLTDIINFKNLDNADISRTLDYLSCLFYDYKEELT